MEATPVPVNQTPFQPPRLNQRITMHNVLRRSSPVILSVLSADKNMSDTSDHQSTTAYNDNWFDRLAINHLSSSLQAAAGLNSQKSGYDGLVEAARIASWSFNAAEQKEIVIQTLVTAIPMPILSLIKNLLPQSKFKREYFATFTTIFFPWLVGPCQVKEGEIEGRTEKNIVYVPKCKYTIHQADCSFRYLDETNCVGMCTNLCKMPSQAFIKDTLGMPFYMVPNFEDMSCEMIFGQEPLPKESDPAFAQPCFKQCKAKNRHQTICTSEAP